MARFITDFPPKLGAAHDALTHLTIAFNVYSQQRVTTRLAQQFAQAAIGLTHDEWVKATSVSVAQMIALDEASNTLKAAHIEYKRLFSILNQGGIL